MYSLEREKFEAARKLLDQATENDPADPVVAAWSAYWHLFCWGQGWTSDAASTAATARELAVKAIRGDPENAESLGIYAHICAFMEKDFDSALHYFERSLRLNPNLPFIWHLSATTYSYIGEPNIALRQLERYCGFAPFDPYFYFWKNAYAIAYIFKNEYAKAVTVGQRVTEANPNFINGYKPLIAALGHLDRRDEARPYLDKLLSLEPSFTVESFGRTYPFRKQDDRERYMKGLLLAGAPKT